MPIVRPRRRVIVRGVAPHEDEDLKWSVQCKSDEICVSHLPLCHRNIMNQLFDSDREIPMKQSAIRNQWTNVLVPILWSFVILSGFTASEGPSEKPLLFLWLIV